MISLRRTESSLTHGVTTCGIGLYISHSLLQISHLTPNILTDGAVDFAFFGIIYRMTLCQLTSEGQSSYELDNCDIYIHAWTDTTCKMQTLDCLTVAIQTFCDAKSFGIAGKH